ncbi:hypothetical protein TNCV_2916101 [Trichonephila clavipes]|nr:hypothetical protein TNCV_2916101 [Trichonephila clavipes]
MRLNKSSMLGMLAETTRIRVMRSSNSITDASYTSDFKWPQKKKSKGLRSGKCGGKNTGPSRPVHFLGYVV